MHLIDTHSHINLKEFTGNLAETIKKAQDAGVQKICVPNVDSGSIESVKQVSKEFPEIVLPMMGIHPTSIKENYKEELNIITKELESGKYIAVGEIGMDLYWDKTFLNQQKEAFAYQLQLADQHNLPVNIHIRNAFDEAFEVLESLNKTSFKGIFHCFSGNVTHAHKAIEMGFLLGIGGVVTFKNSGLDKVVSQLSLEHFVLETDAPWLAPTPFRSKQNEPSYIPFIAQKLADIFNTDLETVAEITTNNAQNIFNI